MIRRICRRRHAGQGQPLDDGGRSRREEETSGNVEGAPTDAKMDHAARLAPEPEHTQHDEDRYQRGPRRRPDQCIEQGHRVGNTGTISPQTCTMRTSRTIQLKLKNYPFPAVSSDCSDVETTY